MIAAFVNNYVEKTHVKRCFAFETKPRCFGVRFL